MEAYLDYNATTPLDPLVLEAMRPYLDDDFGNASSFHRKGQAARGAVELARERLADYLQVEPGDILFTSGGTESDNLAIKGAMERLGPERRHLVVSAVEHQAVLYPARALAKQGVPVSTAPVDGAGIVDLDYLKDAITDRTALVSVMHVNNETGTIQPIEEVARLAHAKGALFHADAVQSFGKLSLPVEEIGCDLTSFSAHKICGPKGVGALYVRKGLRLKPLLHGGHQEKNIRPGTENVAAIAGFGRAVELVRRNQPAEAQRVRRLRDAFHEGLRAAVSGIRLNGHARQRVYNTLNLSFDGLDGEVLLMNLDFERIYVSTGSACTAGSVEPSHVLLAMGIPEPLARAAVRFSLGRFTTDGQIRHALDKIPSIVRRLRANAAGKTKEGNHAR